MAQQNGYILLPVVLAISLVAVIAFMMNNESAIETNISNSELESDRGRYLVEAGMNHALWQVTQAGCGPFTDIIDQPFGSHSYSAAITPNNAGGLISSFSVPVSDDAWIKSDTPAQNYGNDAQLSTYFNLFPSVTQRTLYRFDIENAGILAGSTVVSAVARIFIVDSNDFAPVTVHQITTDWAEGTVNWDNINTSHDTNSITSIPAGSPAGGYVSVNITSLVQGWVNGSTANQGIMLKTQGISDLTQYASKEYGVSSQRPSLEIKISDGSLSNRADITASGTLANGTTHTLQRYDIPLYQPPGTVVLQPGATEGMDTYLYEWKPDWNHGAMVSLSVSDQWGSDEHALLRFNLSAIPRGARIIEASLQLNSNGSSWPSTTLTAHRVNNAWTEGSQTGGVGDGANWNNRDTGTAWNSAGGDYELNSVASAVTPGAVGWVSWDITPLVDDWINAGIPNYGLLLAPTASGQGADFDSSDAADAAVHPKLTISYSCECGITCQAPHGSGNILLVVVDEFNMTSDEQIKRALFENWGYTVNLISQWDVDWNFDTLAASNDVAYVSESVDDTTWGLAPKLAASTIGVVNEEGAINDDLGTSGSYSNSVGKDMDIIDTSHYITSLFPAGSMPIYSANMEFLLASGTQATSLQTLANDFYGAPVLAVVETGGLLADGSSTAAGRRVMLPIGRNAGFNWDHLNNNGRLIVQRAIQWGTGNTGAESVLIYRDEFSNRNCDAADYTGSNGALDWSPWAWLETADDGTSCGGTIGIAEDAVVIEPGNYRLFISSNTRNIARQVDLSAFAQAYLSFDYRAHTLNNNNSIIIEAWDDAGSAWVEAGRFTGPLKHETYRSTTYNISPYISANAAIRIVSSGLGISESLYIDNLQISEIIPPPPEPIAHWMLDETTGTIAVDSAGGHNGTLLNAPVWTAAQVAGGLKFDGASDYINVPHDDTLSLTETLTFMAWINPAAIGASYNTVLAKDGGGTDSNFWFGLFQDELGFGLYSSGLYRGVLSSGLNVQAGSWQHIAASFNNATDELLFYLDGTLVHSASFSFLPTAVTADLSIGRSPDGEYWQGILDDVRIYNSVLTATDISNIYNAGAPGLEPGSCDGSYRDEFNTISYAGNDGTLTWSMDWLESGDTGGEFTGDLKVTLDLSNNRLQVMNKSNIIEREMDLTGAAAATLTFDYRRVGLDKSDETIIIDVSADGGNSWTSLESFAGPGDDVSYLNRSYDMSGFIAANTRIRFITSSKVGLGEGIFVDNVEIICTP